MSKKAIMSISSTSWLTINIAVAIIGGALYYIFINITNSLPANEALNFIDKWSPLVLFIEAIFIVLSLVSIRKVNNWARVVPVISVFISLGIFSLVGFFYWFNL